MNKETLQSYNTRLSTNNTTLKDIFNVVNELPEIVETKLQDKEVTPTKEIQTITSDEGYDGLNEVKVNSIPDEYIIPDGTLEVAENGDIDVTTFKTARVGVYVPPTLQDKSITITENGTQNITYDEGYDGLKSVEVTTNIGGGGKYAPKFCSFYTYDGTDLTEEIANLDTSNFTSMKSMFGSCVNLPSLDLSSFDTSNVTTMQGMFRSCMGLKSIDVSNFDTTNVTTMQHMFASCYGLTSLDLSNFYTSNLTNCGEMFHTASGLRYLDIRNFDFTNVTYYNNMFLNVPTYCEIIVKDNTAKEWITSKFTTLTNVKTVAEL